MKCIGSYWKQVILQMHQINISDTLYTKLELLANQENTTIEAIIENRLESSSAESLSQEFNVVEFATDTVVTVDSKQKIVGFNLGAERLFAYEAVDVLGENLSILLPESARTSHPDKATQFIKNDNRSRYMADRQPLKARRKDGSYVSVDILLANYNLAGSNYTIAIIRDITQRETLINRLQESQAHLRLMTDNATDLICLHAPDGTYEFVSNSSQQIIGFESQELIGKNPYDFFHPADNPEIREIHQEILNRDKESTRITYRYRTKSGKYIWFETITKPIVNNNEVTNFVTSSRDVSEQIETQLALKKERDFIQGIMDMSPSAITVVSREGQITLANKRAEEVLGMHKNDITARTYDAPAWNHTDNDGNPWPEEEIPFVRIMASKAPVWDVRHAIDKPDGERIYLAISGMPMFDESGEITQVIFTIEDYTDRKNQQNELEASLAREKQLNKMKSEFLSIVSHEFKTPLSVIMTSTGLIRLKHTAISPENLIERLRRIEKQVDRLNQLINDVTFINKSELVGHLVKPSAINLQKFFEEIFEDLRLGFPNVANVLLIKKEETQETIVSDNQLMHFIFDNLISNAMKYSGKNGSVEINYSCDDTYLTVLVSDDGIGIPDEDQRNLFEIFHRARNVGNIKGTGLGLSIVKSCLDALDGDISFESIENEGTRVLVKLPLIRDSFDAN